MIIGVLSAFKAKDRRLWLYLIPFLLAEVLLFAAGTFQRSANETIPGIAILGFVIVQVALTSTLPFRLRGARFPAVALSIFSIVYGSMVTLIAGMAFTGDWI